MRQVEHTGEIRVDQLAAPSKIEENGLLTPIALISLEAGDPAPDGLRSVGRTTFHDLSVQGREFTLVEADGDLRGHERSIPQV
jgi:hypothetical protein